MTIPIGLGRSLALPRYCITKTKPVGTLSWVKSKFLNRRRLDLSQIVALRRPLEDVSFFAVLGEVQALDFIFLRNSEPHCGVKDL